MMAVSTNNISICLLLTIIHPWHFKRYAEIERGPFIGLRLHPNSPQVPFYYLLGYRQTYAGARILVLGMQPLKQLEQAAE